MLSVISPAKALDFESAPAVEPDGMPRLLDRSEQLAAEMSRLPPGRIAALMALSDPLAELTAERSQAWSIDHQPPGARAAVLAFAGDTYRGLRAGERFDRRDYRRAQRGLRILSGLYGLLRPLDAIRPYRLEMGTRLATARGEDLYDFWGSEITELLRGDLEESPGPAALVNLASAEYFGAIDERRLDARVITPSFLDWTKKGDLRVIGVHAKRARGAMAGWMISERVSSLRALSEFDELGYRYDAERSGPDAPVFVRDRAA